MRERLNRSDLTLTQVLLRRNAKISYDTVPTKQDGIALRVERSGKVPKLTAKAIGNVALIGKLLADSKDEIRDLQDAVKEPGDEIRQLAYAKPGFRGIEVREGDGGFVLAVTPVYAIDWDYDRLRKALGASYDAVVTETLKTSLLLPLGKQTDYGPLTSEVARDAIYDNGLIGLGFSNEELDQLVTFNSEAEVDEGKLGDMIMAGQLRLAPSVGKVNLTFKLEPRSVQQ